MFQYHYQDLCLEDFNVDALFHVSVSGMFQYLSFFYLTFNCAYIKLLLLTVQENATPFTQNMVTSKFSYLLYVPGYYVLDSLYGFVLLRENSSDFAN